MAMKRHNFLILLIVLLLCSSLVFARVYEQKQKKEVPDASNDISSVGGGTVKQNQAAGGLKEADFYKKKHCMGCKLFMKHCCGFFCCTEEEYLKYMKGEAVLPHN